MKVLPTIQSNLALLGFYPNQQQNSNKAFGKLQTLGIGFSMMGTSLVAAYFLFLANSTEEHMYSLFLLVASISLSTSQISLAIENDKIFNTIDMFEKLFGESEFQFYYIDYKK